MVEGSGPDKETEKAEIGELVWKGMNAISPKYREIIVLYDFERFSYNEISEILGMSLSSVKVTLHRARNALYERLKPYRGCV